MAGKKDFSQVNTSPVFSAIAEATAAEREHRRTYTEEEAAALQDQGETRGRKGVKMPRINLAITPSNLDYVKIMCRTTGQTYQEFMNTLILQHKETHAETYNKAKELLKDLQG